MKNIFKTAIALFAVSSALVACQPQATPVEFGIDKTEITVGAEGGAETVRLSSEGKWHAEVTGYEGKETPWISVSPLSGTGSMDCQISIDTTLLAKTVRTGNIRFYSGDKHIDLRVNQAGYENLIYVEKTEYEVPEYAKTKERFVRLKVTANVDFKLTIDQGAYYTEEGAEVSKSEEWIEMPKFDFELDRESRPRTINIDVKWQGNTQPYIRKGAIRIDPVESGVEGNPSAEVSLTQKQAPKIENNRLGDSLAIVAIARSLGMPMSQYEGEKMDNWDFVTLWSVLDDEKLMREVHETHTRNNTDEHGNPIPFNKDSYIGRVRSVSFHSIYTEEDLPEEIKFLTTIETLGFGSNGNSMLKYLGVGSGLPTLTQLKQLKIWSYGLSEFDESMKNLSHLEYLDLSGNNFNYYPEVITVDNFPKLKYLDIAANKRYIIVDMTTATRPPEEWGGLSQGGTIESGRTSNFPVQVLDFPEMEYLSLSNNYMFGQVPDIEEIEAALGHELPVWTADEVAANDTLQSAKPEAWDLVGKPKILPKCRYRFSINLNLFHGELPDWILYHPMLMFWAPDILIFNQDTEYRDINGVTPGFTNIPADPNYYYEVYPLRKPEEFE